MILSIAEWKTLMEHSQAPCVSIYMPTHRVGAQTQQNPIRFKNLMREAESKLQEQRLRSTEIDELLKPALNLDQEGFWTHQDQGLAIFLAPDFSCSYRLPLKFEELVMVGDRFQLKPLLPLLTGDGQFYILALSQKQVRLFEGTRYHVHEITLTDVPTSMAEALQYDETAKEGQFRISTTRGGTNNAALQVGSVHGQGSPDQDDNKRDILQFFHQLDQGLQKYFRSSQAPLVIAGVEYLLPIYQEANTHPHLLPQGITENPEGLKPEELHGQAWKIVEPYFLQAQQAAMAHYYELSGTGKSSSDLKEVISAAHFGRVDQLFVALGQHQWGQFKPETQEVLLHSQAEPGDADLLDEAAVQTVLNGGIVYAVELDKVPDTAPLAASFRY